MVKYSLVAQDSKESTCNAGDSVSIPGLGRFPWRRERQPTAVSLPGKSRGWRSVVGYSPWSHRVRQDWALTHIHYIKLTILDIFKGTVQRIVTKLGSTLLQAVKPIYWHQLSFSGGKMQCLSQMPSKESKQLVLKMPELPKAFRKQFLKTGWVRGVVGCCDQLMAIPLIGWWWGNQESTSLTF